MIILPAIDIKNGECVRLYQGDYDRTTTYDADPVQLAQRWQDAGASWLHNPSILRSLSVCAHLHRCA